MARVSTPEPRALWSHVTQEREAALCSLQLHLGKIFSFPLHKMLPMATSPTPSTGGDKSPARVSEERREAVCLRGTHAQASTREQHDQPASQPHVTPPTSHRRKNKIRASVFHQQGPFIPLCRLGLSSATPRGTVRAKYTGLPIARPCQPGPFYRAAARGPERRGGQALEASRGRAGMRGQHSVLTIRTSGDQGPGNQGVGGVQN